jgi:hypothetical protein
VAADPQSQASRPFASEEKEQPQTEPPTRLLFALKINPRIVESSVVKVIAVFPTSTNKMDFASANG